MKTYLRLRIPVHRKRFSHRIQSRNRSRRYHLTMLLKVRGKVAMPRISHSGPSNWMPQEPGQQREDLSSAGINSLTSESKQDKSGASSGTDHQSPVQSAENPSGKDRPSNQESSSASSTGGSGQETSSARPNQQGSSAGNQAKGQATQGRQDPKSGGSKRASSS